MKRTIGTGRMVVAGMVLLGGVLGIFGDMRLAATNQVFPRVPRTEQEQQAADIANSDGRLVTKSGYTFLARSRSRDGDPCVPTAPVAFLPHAPVMC